VQWLHPRWRNVRHQRDLLALGNGPRTALVTISDDAPGSPHVVQLTGTGTGAPVTRPGISISPTSISFPPTTQGTSSLAQTVTLTCAGSAPLHLSSISLTGSNSADFTLTNGCVAPAYLASASCTLGVVFTPSLVAVGPRSASVAIADDAPGSPQLVQIGGLWTNRPRPHHHTRVGTHVHRHSRASGQSRPDRLVQPTIDAGICRHPHSSMRGSSAGCHLFGTCLHDGDERNSVSAYDLHHRHWRSNVSGSEPASPADSIDTAFCVSFAYIDRRISRDLHLRPRHRCQAFVACRFVGNMPTHREPAGSRVQRRKRLRSERSCNAIHIHAVGYIYDRSSTVRCSGKRQTGRNYSADSANSYGAIAIACHLAEPCGVVERCTGQFAPF